MSESLRSPAAVISIVLPAFNEESSLEQVMARIAGVLENRNWEIVVVDDGSQDGTWSVVERLNANDARIRGLRLSRNFGHQSAMLAGLSVARGDAVITMDADGQHPPELIGTLIERWQGGAEVVQGLRTGSAGAGPFKRWTSGAFYRVLSRLAAVEVREGSADFRLLSRGAVTRVLETAGPMLFLRGLIPWLGLATDYVPFEVEARVGGRSNYTLRKMIRLSLDGILGFSIVPLRIATTFGLGVSSISFMYLLYITVIRFTSEEVVPGWASTAGLLSFLGGIQLLTLGILGEYLGRIFLSTLNRPPFVVSREIGGGERASPEDVNGA